MYSYMEMGKFNPSSEKAKTSFINLSSELAIHRKILEREEALKYDSEYTCSEQVLAFISEHKDEISRAFGFGLGNSDLKDSLILLLFSTHDRYLIDIIKSYQRLLGVDPTIAKAQVLESLRNLKLNTRSSSVLGRISTNAPVI